jgi:hypothetical protein
VYAHNDVTHIRVHTKFTCICISAHTSLDLNTLTLTRTQARGPCHAPRHGPYNSHHDPQIEDSEAKRQ